MNNNIQEIEYHDELRERYNKLSFTNEIENLAEYAVEWLKLSADAHANNRPALAAMSKARADYYGGMTNGEYIRLIEGSFSELLKIQ